MRQQRVRRPLLRRPLQQRIAHVCARRGVSGRRSTKTPAEPDCVALRRGVTVNKDPGGGGRCKKDGDEVGFIESPASSGPVRVPVSGSP